MRLSLRLLSQVPILLAPILFTDVQGISYQKGQSNFALVRVKILIFASI